MDLQEVQKRVAEVEEFAKAGAITEAKELEYKLLFDVCEATAEGDIVNPEACYIEACSFGAINLSNPQPEPATSPVAVTISKKKA